MTRGVHARIAASLLLASLAARGSQAAEGRSTLWIAGYDCPDCPAALQSSLESLAGVRSVEARFDQGQALVLHDPTLRPESLVDAVVRAGFKAGLEPGRLREPNLLESFAAGSDVKVIVRSGEDADVTTLLAADKVTVVDFFATWCLPCRGVERKLARLLAADPRLAVRRVNVGQWSSPIARRYLKEVDGLPFLQIYDRDGKLIAELSGPATRDLERFLARAAGDSARSAP